MPTPLAALLAAALAAVASACFDGVARREPPARWLARRPGPAVLLSAALAVLVVLARHGTNARVLGVVLVAVLVPVSLIDVETRKIPNRVTGPAAILAIVLGLLLRPAGVPIQLGAGLAGAGFLLLFALIHPKGLGMGDVKLAGVLGLYLGASVAVALFAGVLAAAAGGLVVLARAGVAKGRTLKIPLGPYLATGGLLAALAGPAILHWYVHSVLR